MAVASDDRRRMTNKASETGQAGRQLAETMHSMLRAKGEAARASDHVYSWLALAGPLAAHNSAFQG